MLNDIDIYTASETNFLNVFLTFLQERAEAVLLMLSLM